LLDIQDETRDATEFWDHVKVDLFPDAVYVFTPKSKIMAMPRGATIVSASLSGLAQTARALSRLPTTLAYLIAWSFFSDGVFVIGFLGGLYANSRTLRIADGPDEVHRNHIGKLELARFLKF
jgi:hypothetical protein